MKHLDIIKAKKHELISPMIATITGNNFGDQIIEFRIYRSMPCNPIMIEGRTINTMWGYSTHTIITNFEGEHWTNAKILKFGKSLK